MLRDDLLLRTRLTPPRPHRRVLPRPQLTARLRDALDCRLTIAQAGTGYGKTTALAALKDDATHLFWLTLDESDRDPQQFLTYLIAAFRIRLPELPEAPLALLGELSNGGLVQPSQVIDALINALAAWLARSAISWSSPVFSCRGWRARSACRRPSRARPPCSSWRWCCCCGRQAFLGRRSRL